MVKVIAKHVGYYNGKVREVGEEFELASDDLGAGLPSWVELADGEELIQTQVERKPVRRNKVKAEPDAASARVDEGGQAAADGEAEKG